MLRNRPYVLMIARSASAAAGGARAARARARYAAAPTSPAAAPTPPSLASAGGQPAPTKGPRGRRWVHFAAGGLAAAGTLAAGYLSYKWWAPLAWGGQPAVAVHMVALPTPGLKTQTLFEKQIEIYSGSPPIGQLERAGVEAAQKIAAAHPEMAAGTVAVYGTYRDLKAGRLPRSRLVLSHSAADGVQIAACARDIE